MSLGKAKIFKTGHKNTIYRKTIDRLDFTNLRTDGSLMLDPSMF